MKIRCLGYSAVIGTFLSTFSLSVFATPASRPIQPIRPEVEAKSKNLITKIMNENLQDLTEVDMGDKYPWPRVTLYQKIDATPEEAEAVFTDFENYKYLKDVGVESVQIAPSNPAFPISPLHVDLDYKISLPLPYNSDEYQMHDILGTYPSDPSKDPSEPTHRGYSVQWVMTRAGKHTVGSVGSARFEPYVTGIDADGNPKIVTLFAYESFVEPKTSWLTWTIIKGLKGQAIQRVRDISKAIGEHVEDIKNHDPKLMDELKAKLANRF